MGQQKALTRTEAARVIGKRMLQAIDDHRQESGRFNCDGFQVEVQVDDTYCVCIQGVVIGIDNKVPIKPGKMYYVADE